MYLTITHDSPLIHKISKGDCDQCHEVCGTGPPKYRVGIAKWL